MYSIDLMLNDDLMLGYDCYACGKGPLHVYSHMLSEGTERWKFDVGKSSIDLRVIDLEIGDNF